MSCVSQEVIHCTRSCYTLHAGETASVFVVFIEEISLSAERCGNFVILLELNLIVCFWNKTNGSKSVSVSFSVCMC